MRDLKKEFQTPYGVTPVNAVASLDSYYGTFNSIQEAYDLIPEGMRVIGKLLAIYKDSSKQDALICYWGKKDNEWKIFTQSTVSIDTTLKGDGSADMPIGLSDDILAKIMQGMTAYSWGDHSLKNYVINVENAPNIGFTNGNKKEAPYFKHSDGTVVFLSTQDWVNNQSFVNLNYLNSNYYNQTETNNLINDKLGNVYKIKGSVATYNDLPPLSTVNVGDVYNVIDTGMNYVKIPSNEWDSLGSTANLSDYHTISQYQQWVIDQGYAKGNFVRIDRYDEITADKLFDGLVKFKKPIYLWDDPVQSYGLLEIHDSTFIASSNNSTLFLADKKNSNVVFYGDKTVNFKWQNITNNVELTIPNKTGTIALTSDILPLDGYLKRDSALIAGFVNGNSQNPYMRHDDQTVVELASKNWVNGQGYAFGLENAKSIGFTNGDKTKLPYIKHSDGTVVFLSTQDSADGEFVKSSGSTNIGDDFNIRTNNNAGLKFDSYGYPTLYYDNNELKISGRVVSFNGSAEFGDNDVSAGTFYGSKFYTSGGDSDKWNEAYSWGNHATAGYLKGIPYTLYTSASFITSFTQNTFGTDAAIPNFRVIKTGADAPSQLIGGNGVGLAFKGDNVHGAFTLSNGGARVRFTGGSGTGLTWAADVVLTEGDSVKNGSLEVKDLIIGGAYGQPNGLFRGTADNASFTGANIDLKTWNGLGIIDSSSGNRNIVFNARNGNILTKGIVASEGYSKRGLSDDYLLTANGGATHKQTFLSLDYDGSGNAINLNQDTDFNTITKTGFYRCDTSINAPSGKSWYHIIIESHENGGGWCKQTATSYATGGIENGITFTRVNVGGSWQPWKRLITDTDNAGINLLVASKNWSKNWVSNNGATIASIVYNGFAVSKATSAWSYLLQKYNFEVGKTYTLSAYVMCPNNNAINCGIYLFDNWSHDFGAVPSSWKRVSKTFTVTSAMVGSDTNRNVRIESGGSSDVNPLYLAGMKLEESNFPSPWSMNPADIVDTYSPQTIDGNKTFTGATYFPKARIQDDGNVVTDSFGMAFQWNQAYNWGNHATAGYLKSDSASFAGFVNGNSQNPYIRHYNRTVVELASKDWVNGNFVDKWNAQDINGTKKFGSTIIANSGIDVSNGNAWGKFFGGNGDGATIATCNSDIGSWWGFGLGHTYTGNYTRTIAFDCRNGSATYSGSITATAFYESSLRKYKKNIVEFEKSGLDLVNDLDIVRYDRKDGIKNKIGIILDDSPKEFASESGEEVDLYKTIFIQAKAIQELSKELEDLKQLINSKL